MFHVVIMAGGSGTRFWPKSRRNRPKQLLKLFGERTMLQDTLDRIAPMVEPENVLVVTGADQAVGVREQLPEVPPANVVGEPCPRDTAPCVALAAAIIAKKDPEGTMIVKSADHVIRPPEKFRATVKAALGAIEADPTAFVTFGVRPTRPETGYGYIEQGEKLGEADGVAVYKVSTFKEKPDLETARRYLAAGNTVWNAGIFVWRACAVLDALRRFHPEIAEVLDEITPALGTPEQAEAIARAFPRMTKIPIDKAVMERYENVRVVEVVYDWSDVGDWRSLAEQLTPDTHGNTTQGPAHLVDCRGTVVIADEDRPIMTLGLDDVVIVQSGGATLVAKKDQLDGLKKLVEGLDAAGYGDYL